MQEKTSIIHASKCHLSVIVINSWSCLNAQEAQGQKSHSILRHRLLRHRPVWYHDFQDLLFWEKGLARQQLHHHNYCHLGIGRWLYHFFPPQKIVENFCWLIFKWDEREMLSNFDRLVSTVIRIIASHRKKTLKLSRLLTKMLRLLQRGKIQDDFENWFFFGGG